MHGKNEFHRLFRLSLRKRYFARDFDSPIVKDAKDSKDVDTYVSQAACSDFLTSTSILVQASAVPPNQPGEAKYFLLIDPNALSVGPAGGGERNLQIELATCMFNERGLPLQFNRQTITQKFSDSEFQSLKSHGITHTISLVPKQGTTRVRLVVCDSRTGMIGSVDLPYPGQILSVPTTDRAAAEAPKTPSQPSAPAQAPSHVIKFHDKEGRTGILQWNTGKLLYAGGLPAEASARGMYDSLWGKSFSCEAGKLVSVSDKTTSAPQPLHFRSDDNHSAEVLLDSTDGVQYSGDLVVDSSAKPVFEALRTLYQRKNPAVTNPLK